MIVDHLLIKDRVYDFLTFRQTMIDANTRGELIYGLITFSNRSFIQDCPWLARTYIVASNETYFSRTSDQNTLHGYCVENDWCVRLDECMLSKVNPWIIEACRFCLYTDMCNA